MKTAVIYARYSSERQTEQSIEGQIRVCREYAEKHDIFIVDMYIDRAMTGTNDLRDAFQRMMKDSAKQAWNYVLVYKFDRFSRNKYECTIHKHTLKENGVKVISAMENIPDSPEGIILESLLEGMNQYYSMELSQKVLRGQNETRLKGNFTGGIVFYGYRVKDKKLIIEEDEAKVVRYIFNQYADGTYVKDIIADLTEKSIFYKGKTFPRTVIYNMLKNEKYSGVYTHNGKVYTNIYPAIVPEHLFDAVRTKALHQRFGKHDSAVRYLLKNKVKCGYCGMPMSSEAGTARDGDVRRYYKCYGRKTIKNGCTKSVVRKEELEKLVVDVTIKVLSDDEQVSALADRILEINKSFDAENPLINLLLKEKQSIQTSIDNLVSAIERGVITSSTKQRLSELEKRMDEIEVKILTERSRQQAQISRNDIFRYLKLAVKKEPQRMIRLLIKEIVLYDDKIEIYYNYTDRQKPDDNDRRAFSFYTEELEWSHTTQHSIFRKKNQEITTTNHMSVTLFV